MRQLVQSVKSGELRLIDAPRPVIGPTEVLVRTSHSVVSAGTERAVRELASGSLVDKARARPDLVRQVVRKARQDGVGPTVRAVRARLDDHMPLGYSGAGVVLEVGEAVRRVRPGMRVATGGSGHGDLQLVSGPLAVPLPSGVSLEDASFATIAAIALQGLRQADVGVGGKVCVIGLGLVGQLTVRLAQASGLDVAGIDVRPWAVERAAAAGATAFVEAGEDTTKAILEWSRGRGVDAVLLTAATPSSDPVRRAPAIARDRGVLVAVGDIGLELSRTPLYEKELTLRLARSYGPGRYDLSYEDWGVDYPVGHVRWTEGRNMEAVMDLLASGRLAVGDLVTHRFTFADAAAAYGLLEDRDANYFGVQLVYPDAPPNADRTAPSPASGRPSGTGLGLVGAGNFAKSVLLPAFREAGFDRRVAVTSASGTSAVLLAEQAGFDRVALDLGDLLATTGVDIVVVATSHESHASIAVRALLAGKHVFCEKPLALSVDELLEVTEAWRAGGGHLAVGFNRRHAPAIDRAKSVLGPSGSPLVLTYRVNAGPVPEKHWFRDRRHGGRLLGEVCHFVDTCNAVVGHPVRSVSAIASGGDEVLLGEDVIVSLAYEDGSMASITYAAGGHRSTPKERLEILGRGHSIVVDDYRRMNVDGEDRRASPQDKGHTAQLVAFREALRRGGDPVATEAALHSSAATLAAAAALLDGCAHVPTGL
jgi:hypothetical protein